MKTIKDIYSEYRIMPSLALHQLRVASVAKLITDNFQKEVDKENVILACLFHDMGNIIKSDLSRFPDFLEPEGLEYWQKVKDNYLSLYGTDDHKATEMIAKEVGLPDNTFKYLSRIGFSKMKMNNESDDFGYKICSYSDMRVGPYGVLPMEERVSEANKRYQGSTHTIGSDNFGELTDALRNIEKQIFEYTDVRPEDITDEAIQEIMEELGSKEI